MKRYIISYNHGEEFESDSRNAAYHLDYLHAYYGAIEVVIYDRKRRTICGAVWNPSYHRPTVWTAARYNATTIKLGLNRPLM